MLKREIKQQITIRCLDTIADYQSLVQKAPGGQVMQEYNHPKGFLGYIDNGADILAAVHLDYVSFTKPSFTRNAVHAGQLDDRLGAWMILDALPSMGIKTDILLTDNEEIGESTAQFFCPSKDYRYCFSFDRPGVLDPALYDQITNHRLCDTLHEVGLNPTYGVFSDVAYLALPKVNFGCGYQQHHTDKSFATIRDIKHCLDFFQMWYENTKEIKFDYDDSHLDSRFTFDEEWDATDNLVRTGLLDYLDGYTDYQEFMRTYELTPREALEQLGIDL